VLDGVAGQVPEVGMSPEPEKAEIRHHLPRRSSQQQCLAGVSSAWKIVFVVA
jgi:hypothetical protein